MADDPLLVNMRTEIEAKLPQEMKDGYQRIVVAGMKILFSDETHEHVRQVMSAIAQRGNTPEDIANGMVNMLGLIHTESKGRMQGEAAFPALVTLTSYALEYMEKTQGLKVDQAFVKQLGQVLLQKFKTKFGMDKAGVGSGPSAPNTGGPTPGPGAPAPQPPQPGPPQGGMINAGGA